MLLYSIKKKWDKWINWYDVDNEGWFYLRITEFRCKMSNFMYVQYMFCLWRRFILLWKLSIEIFTATFVKTPDGKRLVMYNGYTYSRYYANKNGIRYKCSKASSRNCKAAMVLDGAGKILRGNVYHNHSPPECKLTTGNCENVSIYVPNIGLVVKKNCYWTK